MSAPATPADPWRAERERQQARLADPLQLRLRARTLRDTAAALRCERPAADPDLADQLRDTALRVQGAARALEELVRTLVDRQLAEGRGAGPDAAAELAGPTERPGERP